jgi:hypothetical protein
MDMTNCDSGSDDIAALPYCLLISGFALLFAFLSSPSGLRTSATIASRSRSLCVSKAQADRMPYTSPVQLSLPAPLPPTSSSAPVRLDTSESISTPTPATRPNLPRSYSSTAYIRRHRRSPSVSKSVLLPAVESSTEDVLPRHAIVDPHASLRQSPPPVNNAMIPAGAIISPPESGANSSDDDLSPTGPRRGRVSLDKLDAAIRSLQQEREAMQDGTTATPSRAVNAVKIERPSLTAEARKISHSRSSTESAIPKLVESSSASSSDSDPDEEVDMTKKPPMLRKKSGELVRPALRPASRKQRPSSMPGTPTFGKNVHFDTHLEHIKHFLQLDKPLAVSANTSPVENYSTELEYPFHTGPVYEWEIRLANFPKDTASRARAPVRLERMFLSSDNKTLVGVVAVANVAFHKRVVARFTLDYWKTVSEVGAEYNHDVRRRHAHDGYDRFNFTIKLADQANLENKTMFVCIRYNVGGHEFWDNNKSMNYQVDFARKEKAPSSEKCSATSSSGHAAPALPRSRVLPVSSGPRPKSMPPSLDDFGSELSAAFPSFGRDSRTAGSAFRLTRVDSHDLYLDAPKRREKPVRQAFGNRYDFGVSLSAAMQSKDATQDRTILAARAKSEGHSSPPGSSSRVGASNVDALAGPTTASVSPAKDTTQGPSLKPSSIVSSKPHLESSVYKELVDKYCFVRHPSAHTADLVSPN